MVSRRVRGDTFSDTFDDCRKIDFPQQRGGLRRQLPMSGRGEFGEGHIGRWSSEAPARRTGSKPGAPHD